MTTPRADQPGAHPGRTRHCQDGWASLGSHPYPRSWPVCRQGAPRNWSCEERWKTQGWVWGLSQVSENVQPTGGTRKDVPPNCILWLCILPRCCVLHNPGFDFSIARKTTFYAINATVHTRTRTHWISTWSPNIQNSQHKQVREKVHVKVLYVVNVACTVVQQLHSGFIFSTHKKTPCPFCPQKFFDAASWNKHVGMKHSDRSDRKLNCRLAPNCKQTFNSIKELGIHSRQAHWKTFPFRCNYKNCFDCYRTIDALVKHGRTHGRETWDATAKEKEARYKCSLCPETFWPRSLSYCLTPRYTRKISTRCDECDWKFPLIAGLTYHGQDCHDTRHHACSWCIRIFRHCGRTICPHKEQASLWMYHLL